MKITFYRWMLWMMEFEHAIGKASGRNPRVTSALRCDIANMQTYITKLEANA